MPDREKVIKALEYFNKNRICLPHLIPWDEITDAIALLKEQDETVVPVKHIDNDKKHGRVMVWWGCPVCNFLINGKETKFCGGCGKKVKWE